jgi:NAD(P)-dependent dehydrogenase (short-subunit alcohol dehydrogenase family)
MMLRGMTALVTGGTGAVGSAVANLLSKEGARVFASVRSRGRKSKGNLLDSTVEILEADLLLEAQVVALYETILQKASKLDIVVNTVGGFLPAKPLVDVSLEEWRGIIDLNLTTTFLSTREAIRRMVSQGSGHIINFSALAAMRQSTKNIPYVISKYSVDLFTERVAREVEAYGIMVNTIAPSIVLTPANLEWAQGEDTSKWVKPEEIAEMIRFLCSPAGRLVTGSTLRMGGGL